MEKNKTEDNLKKKKLKKHTYEILKMMKASKDVSYFDLQYKRSTKKQLKKHKYVIQKKYSGIWRKISKNKFFSKLKKSKCLMCIDQKLLFLNRKHITRK